MFRGKIPLNNEEYAMAKGYRTEPERTKVLEELVKERSKGNVKWATDPAAYKEEQIAVEGRMRDVDPNTKRQIYNDADKRGISRTQAAAEYFRKQDGVAPSATTTPSTTAPRIGTGAIAQVETGNRQGLVSPKGAIGVMQVMPNTNRDPGFGVAPAKDNSEAELKRVGEDYYGAMQKKYGRCK